MDSIPLCTFNDNATADGIDVAVLYFVVAGIHIAVFDVKVGKLPPVVIIQPGIEASTWDYNAVETAYIIEWTFPLYGRGNSSSKADAVEVCVTKHRLPHRGELTMYGDGAQVIFASGKDMAQKAA